MIFRSELDIAVVHVVTSNIFFQHFTVECVWCSIQWICVRKNLQNTFRKPWFSPSRPLKHGATSSTSDLPALLPLLRFAVLPLLEFTKLTWNLKALVFRKSQRMEWSKRWHGHRSKRNSQLLPTSFSLKKLAKIIPKSSNLKFFRPHLGLKHLATLMVQPIFFKHLLAAPLRQERAVLVP